MGSGDVVSRVASLSQQMKAGSLSAEAEEFPSLVSVDGDIGSASNYCGVGDKIMPTPRTIS